MVTTTPSPPSLRTARPWQETSLGVQIGPLKGVTEKTCVGRRLSTPQTTIAGGCPDITCCLFCGRLKVTVHTPVVVPFLP